MRRKERGMSISALLLSSSKLGRLPRPCRARYASGGLEKGTYPWSWVLPSPDNHTTRVGGASLRPVYPTSRTKRMVFNGCKTNFEFSFQLSLGKFVGGRNRSAWTAQSHSRLTRTHVETLKGRNQSCEHDLCTDSTRLGSKRQKAATYVHVMW
ncbi:uncharacterized protein EV422DRAFT_254174 [Fimicolochytrium jonesii]|uniref:uncharacterized protein n=1 Tax=Fimicolochytrium jonesii TaxID=1396493 RepID=UPI0022FED823|nr:uncharacterized protein EV422DRAFT_254174 [Fimicolochytrium jonesii]KAI8825292.1 hypothetical protein EV422DRAFT_254174 [Fimicolochytrium jonesii]